MHLSDIGMKSMSVLKKKFKCRECGKEVTVSSQEELANYSLVDDKPHTWALTE